MLRVLGSPKTLCDGVTRREMLTAGSLSLLGLSLPDYLRAAAQPQSQWTTPPGQRFGQAKSCILLFLYGAASQLELADQKPDAPVEIRGELGSIRSSLPGCDVCELLPNTSRVMHNVTVIRTVNHKYPIHGAAYATSSVPEIDVPMELNPRDPRHWPFIGSVVSYLEQQRDPSVIRKPVPDNLALPFPFSSRRKGEVPRAGPYAAFLGSAYNPQFTDFRGTITGKMRKSLRADDIIFDEPYVGVGPDCTFTLGETATPSAEITLDRLNKRKSLLEQFENARRQHDLGSPQHDQFREMAYALIGSEQVRQALDVTREPLKQREEYGLTLFGQSALAARRLVEAGSKFVTVFWDEYGLAGSGWDTHSNHYERYRKELMPGFDKGYAGLIADLDRRGMLDETLVVVMTEHGRTPRINKANGGGRDHWSRAYTTLMAGGGIARGRVIGKTDKIGGDVLDRPVSPKDLLATIYHLLGYDRETHLVDLQKRPLPLVPNGQLLTDALA
ncbi:MAG: DUF1501 domain-containing protein [Bacteroidales bacterium]|nr:DUF1501 domain-containing protein [Bacteroidales bacterium]